jgi:hypothetical protein
MADDSLISLTPQEDIPSGGSMSPGPAMPTPGGSFMSTLGNSLAQAIGYATGNQPLQQQAIEREQENAKMRLLAPVGRAFGDVQARLAAGDLQGANQEYQKIAHLALAIPAIGQLGTKLGEQALGLSQRRQLASAAAQPDFVPGATTPAKPAELTSQLQPGEDEEAAAFLPRTQGEPAKAGVVDQRQAKLGQLVALGVDPEKATKMVYPEYQHVTLDDGSVAILNPRTGQLARAYQGMGKPVQPSESLVTNGPEGPQATYTAPAKLGIPDSLAPFLSPTEQTLYAKGLQDRTPDGLRVADAMYQNAQEKFFASKAPAERKAAAQDLGFSRADIAALEGGTLDPVKSQRITQRLIQVDEVKKADELAQLKAINMQQDPAIKGVPWLPRLCRRQGEPRRRRGRERPDRTRQHGGEEMDRVGHGPVSPLSAYEQPHPADSSRQGQHRASLRRGHPWREPWECALALRETVWR